MKDVRNSHNKRSRLASARRGHKHDGLTPDQYFTWHKWGYLNRHLSKYELTIAFDNEWEKVKQHNLETYGSYHVWMRFEGRYIRNQ